MIRNYKEQVINSSSLKKSDYNESIKPLSIYEQNGTDKAVLKAWVATNIPLETINKIDLFKRLNSSYNPSNDFRY
ncbi:uncharacterized protein OCT59_011720 [Rhizophagus irregularis]|uniref:uncharacterized protein n=1 Tax=Rhizophagus irregularis TaxID=588596 RepID=UPI0033327541|nr:hypothetical protein OCT59_011720 [Rhizophagus irregularis]